VHQDRQKVIEQWDEAKKLIARRDKQIAAVGDQLMDAKEEVRRIQNEVKEQERFFEQEKLNNQQVMSEYLP